MKKTINNDLVNNSNQSQSNEKQNINELEVKEVIENYQNHLFNEGYVESEIEICEIGVFNLEDIIDNPTNEEIEIWKKMRGGSYDGELCSEEIQELWTSELRSMIKSTKKLMNKSQNRNFIREIDVLMTERLPDYLDEELKWIRKEYGDDEISEFLCGDEYHLESPFLNKINSVIEEMYKNNN